MQLKCDPEPTSLIKAGIIMAVACVIWIYKYKKLAQQQQIEALERKAEDSNIKPAQCNAYANTPGLFLLHLFIFCFATLNAALAATCGNPTMQHAIQKSNAPNWLKSDNLFALTDILMAMLAAYVSVVIVNTVHNTASTPIKKGLHYFYRQATPSEVSEEAPIEEKTPLLKAPTEVEADTANSSTESSSPKRKWYKIF